jgi:hypothetical protein
VRPSTARFASAQDEALFFVPLTFDADRLRILILSALRSRAVEASS